MLRIYFIVGSPHITLIGNDSSPHNGYEFGFIVDGFSDNLAALEEELAHVPINPAESRQYIRNVLNKYQSDSNQPDISTSHVAANALSIKKCFGTHVTSVEEIIQNLTLEESQGNEWAKKTLHVSN